MSGARNNTEKILFTIVDMNGYKISITDLEGAIKQCAGFKEYRFMNGVETDFMRTQQAYYIDLHTKLVQLKQELSNNQKIQS